MKLNKYLFNYKKYLPILLIIAVIFMGIGYAAVYSVSLDINGKAVAKVPSGVFISDITVSDKKNSSSNQMSADQTLLHTNLSLSNATIDSYVTYKVTIYNSTSSNYYYTGYSYDNSFYSNTNVSFTVSGISVGSLISSKSSLSFTVTFKYNTSTVPNKNSLDSYISFNFKKGYTVTYENFSSTSNYPTYVLDGDTLIISFGTLDAPIEVKKSNTILSSSNYTYSNYVLTIKNVNGNIHVRKLSKYTIYNMVTNGSFEDGLNGWSFSGYSSEWGTVKIPYHGTYCAYRYPNKSQYNFIMQNMSFISGHTYYFYAFAISSTPQAFVCDITSKGGSFSVMTNGSSWTRGSSIYKANFTGTNNISINWGGTTDAVNVDGVGLVDLTAAFGSGNEPSLEWCNANINYFDNSTIVYK